jgi:hypothetical protein
MQDRDFDAPQPPGGTPFERVRLDRTALRVCKLGEEPSDAAWWRSRPAEERWQATELARQIAYGQSITTARLQRFLAVSRLGEG